MKILNKLYAWYGKKPVWAIGILLLSLLAYIGYSLIVKTVTTNEPAVRPVAVDLTTPRELLATQSTTITGTVTAKTEAELVTERSGRLTSVNTELGYQVQAGQVIATIENSAERASLLSAQGAYEAALVSTNQSQISITDAGTNLSAAKSNAVTTYRNAYGTYSGIIFSQIDPLFANPTSKNPSVRFEGFSQTQNIIAGRIKLQSIITRWQERNNHTTPDNVVAYLIDAQSDTRYLIDFIDTLINTFGTLPDRQPMSEEQVLTLRSSLNSTRANLVNLNNSFENTLDSIKQATSGVERAELTGSNQQPSLSSAQEKQALGALRAAESSLAKTIIRSPISGTVSALNIKTGDFVNMNQAVAVITNANGYEIVTFVSDSEAGLLKVGTEVTINNNLSGTVTNLSPTISPHTGKREARIAIDASSLTAGDTVRITLKPEADTGLEDEVYLPLNTIRFKGETAFVLVVENGKITERAITIGDISNGLVHVTNGLDNDTRIISDARGKQVGQTVTIK